MKINAETLRELAAMVADGAIEIETGFRSINAETLRELAEQVAAEALDNGSKCHADPAYRPRQPSQRNPVVLRGRGCSVRPRAQLLDVGSRRRAVEAFITAKLNYERSWRDRPDWGNSSTDVDETREHLTDKLAELIEGTK